MNISIKNHLTEHLSKWLITLLTGFFLFFVLYFYNGFNIQQNLSFSGHSLLTRTISFGLLTSLSFYVHEFHLARLLSLGSTKQKLIWVFWEILVGANLTFLLFNYFWNGTEWHLDSYELLLREYFSVMVFPILVVYLFTYKRKVSKEKYYLLTIASDNGKHLFRVHPDLLLYLEANDNYVIVHYLSEDNHKTELIRNSLKNIEDQFSNSSQLTRCHRGFMVNPSQIQSIRTRNNQMSLDMGHGQVIPVSKKYTDSFKDHITANHSPHI